MKKIISLVLVAMMLLFTACSAVTLNENKLSNIIDKEVASLIKAAQTEEEFIHILSKYNLPEHQLEIAKSKKYIGQKLLIQSDVLAVEAFIELCKNNEFNMEDSNVVEWFEKAMEKFELTEKQQIDIINSDKFVLHKLLLESSQLTPESYVIMCLNNKLNLNNNSIKELYRTEFERLNFTTEQRKRIINIHESLFQEFIIKSDEVTGEELVMLCQENQFNMKNNNVENWFIETVEKTELNSHQQVAIAHIDEYVYHKAIILKTDISYEALLCLVRNSKLNLDSPEEKQWFMDAIERVNLTKKQKNTLMLTENEIIQDILA